MRTRCPPRLPAVVLASAAIVLVATRSDAVDPPDERDHAVPCRPTVSCTADLAKPGTLELEAGYYLAKSDDVTGRGFPFLLKQTVTSLLQLQAGMA